MSALPRAVLVIAAVTILLIGISALAVGDVVLSFVLSSLGCLLLVVAGILREPR